MPAITSDASSQRAPVEDHAFIEAYVQLAALFAEQDPHCDEDAGVCRIEYD